MDKIIDLETEKKMRLNLSGLFEKEWAFTTTDEFLDEIKEELEQKMGIK